MHSVTFIDGSYPNCWDGIDRKFYPA